MTNSSHFATQLVQREHQLDTLSRSGHATMGKYLFSEDIHCGLTQPSHCQEDGRGGEGGQPARWTNLLNWSFVIVKMNGDIDVRKVGYSCHTECWLWWICWNSLLKCCCYSDPPATPTLLIFNKGSSSALHLSFSPSQPHVCRSFPFSSQTCS